MKSRAWLACGALLCLGALAAALVSQYQFDMQPCPWCVLQRLIFVTIALACIVGFFWRVPGSLLALLLALCGMAAALWQHFKAAASASCNLTLADKIIGALRLDSLWPDVFAARASCADAAVKLFGVPYDLWSLALFVLLFGLACAALRKA